MDHALDGGMGIVADRVGQLLRQGHKLGGIRDELARDRISGVGGIDQIRDGRRHRDGIALRHLLQCLAARGRSKTGLDERVDAAQRLATGRLVNGHALPLPGSATGVQSTSSIRRAPTQSMTSRSKPSAMPEAAGISASAARKSSSTG